VTERYKQMYSTGQANADAHWVFIVGSLIMCPL